MLGPSSTTMTDKPTDAMQEFGEPGQVGPPQPGLVLLFAESYSQLPAAWPVKPGTVVGSDASCNIVLPVHAVSRRHVAFQPSGDNWRITDLQSTNGTLVDGQRVFEGPLEHGQEIRIGDAVLKFVEDGLQQYAPYRIDGSLLPGTRRLCEGNSPILGGYQMDAVSRQLQRVAESGLSVLLLGESGTGKEVAASYLHSQSRRRGPLRALNCAALPHNLLESELFGYRKGAFSGADRDKVGLIQSADGGTLLLDEIGDMPTEAQAKLLRVLQSKELMPLGATQPVRVDVRVVAATHRDLDELLHVGKFRRDLYARLNEFTLRLPPLRDRKEDIWMLLRAFLERQSRPKLSPSFGFMLGALHYDWPLNVRELESCAKRCAVLADQEEMTEALLPLAVREGMVDYGAPLLRGSASEAPGAPTSEELSGLLAFRGGNVAAVARDLGKARMQVHRWIKRYDIDLTLFRS